MITGTYRILSSVRTTTIDMEIYSSVVKNVGIVRFQKK